MFKDILTKEVLEEEYVKREQTVTAIARKFNTSPITVRKHMKRNGIEFRQRTKDLTGEVYGRLKAVYPVQKDRHGKSRWHCDCECGSTAIVNTSSLLRGLTTSCGCRSKEVCRKGGYKDISRSFWRRLVQNAKQRGIEFTITPEIVWEIYENQNRRCSLSGLPIAFFPDSNRRYMQTASIDRIDSYKGYIPENIQIVNKIVNQMKSFLKEEEFIAFCNLVANRRPMSHEDCLDKSSRKILRKI